MTRRRNYEKAKHYGGDGIRTHDPLVAKDIFGLSVVTMLFVTA